LPPLSFPLSPLLPLQFQLQLTATGFVAGALLLLLLLLKRHSTYGTEMIGGDMGDGIGDGHDMGGGGQEAPVVAEASTSSALERTKLRKKQTKRRLDPAGRVEDTGKRVGGKKKRHCPSAKQLAAAPLVMLLVLLLFLLPCWVRSLYPGAGPVWLHMGEFSARTGSLGWRLISLVI
jgi:hypothetical protein